MSKIGRLSVTSAAALTAFLASSLLDVAAAQQRATSDATISKCIHEVNQAQPYNPALGGDDKRRLNLYRACLRNGGHIPGGM